MELGDELGPVRRAGPDAEAIAAYTRWNDIPEGLFSDPEHARALGFRGVVIPGPMLTAFLEQFLRRELAGWQLERLSTTFRLPSIAGDVLVLRGAVTEHHEQIDGERLVCDLVIEHAGAHGGSERAVTGSATLRRPRRAAT